MPLNPLVIPALLAAASTGANMYSAKKKKDYANKYTGINQRANEAEAKKAEEAAARTKEAYRNQPEKMVEQGAALAQKFKGATSQPEDIPTAIRPGYSTDSVVGGYESQRNAGSKRYTDQLSEALGQMRGVDESFLDANLQSRDNLADIRRSTGFMGGNNRLLGQRMLAAQNEGKGAGTAGDVLSMAAMLSSMGALAAPGAAATAAAPAATASGSMAASTPAAAMAADAALMNMPYVAPASIKGGGWLGSLFAAKPIKRIGYGA